MNSSMRVETRLLLRILAVVAGCLIGFKGVTAVAAGEGRPAAAAVVVAAALLWFAVAGRIPSWFRR